MKCYFTIHLCNSRTANKTRRQFNSNCKRRCSDSPPHPAWVSLITVDVFTCRWVMIHLLCQDTCLWLFPSQASLHIHFGKLTPSRTSATPISRATHWGDRDLVFLDNLNKIFSDRWSARNRYMPNDYIK